MAKKQAHKISKQEGNLFDKIFKEVSEKVFLTLVEQRLGLKIKEFRPLKEKMQTTIEREMDFFYEIIPEEGEKFILHLEFETKDPLDMIYRVGEYHGMGLRRMKLPIRHVVIYLGTKTPKMRTQLKPEEVFTGFELVNVHVFNPIELLSSQVPDVVLLAVLANYPPEQAESILRLIVQRLKTLSQNEAELTRYFNQLITFSRLRKIENLTIKITEEMPITYNIETDYLYEQGLEKGLETGIQKGIEKGRSETDYQNKFNFVLNLLKNTDFSNEKIAFLAGVDSQFVEKVVADLNKKSN
ncbi:MAG: Rpn family recombination-promoting nuclease/putative transposase [Saprospiraceae bacterium]|nr:Rpn family recombination-promoting nuclease/putative transposase [Saprospiraceae bacterium]